MNEQFIYKNECYLINGAAIEVHKVLGCGFKEAIYQEAFERELLLRNISFVREQQLPIYYKGELLHSNYRPDFICFDKIIVELKAVDALTNEHYSQILSYLRASDYKLGLLINFGESIINTKRIIRPKHW